MTDDSPPETVSASTHDPEADRYDRISLRDGAVIVYDRDRTSAWIQSDVAVSLPEAAGERTTAGTDSVRSGGR